MNPSPKISFLLRDFIVYLFPPLLIIANYTAFHFFVNISGNKQGYLSGMIFYWLLWCIVPALWWIRKKNRRSLFRITGLNWWQVILLVLPPLLAFAFGPFRSRIGEADMLIIFLSFLYAAANASCEEFLWRGLFFDHHRTQFFPAAIVPSIWFGIWHYVPLSIQPAVSGNFYFILSAVGIGFCWAVVTYYTRSVFWSIISHVLADWSGLGVLYYFR